MTILGYGLDSYGLDSYGGVGSLLALSSAFAVTTRSARVTIDGEPLAHSPYVDGDALNPATWEISRLDDDTSFTVIAVAKVSDRVFDVYTLEPFAPVTVTHRIATTTLRSTLGDRIPVDDGTADFPGVVYVAESTPEKKSAARRFTPVDLANVQTPNADAPGGTLKIGASGDYEEVEGAAFVRKLVMRRLLTRRGAFFHLPDYGLNLDAKSLYTTADLIRLKSEIRRQVRSEPEVDDCSVTLSGPDRDGILGVTVRAKLKTTGQKLDVSLDVPLNSIAL